MKTRYEFTAAARMAAEDVGELDIGGAIVSSKWDDTDVTAADFKAALKKVSKAKTLNVHINSGGGSVYQAVAIKQMLESHKAQSKNIYIDGLCASAATIPACMEGATVHMAKGGMYMIHNPMTFAAGDYNEMLKTADILDKMAGEFAAIYAGRTMGDQAAIRMQMDEETWMTADEAKAQGFVDIIDEGSTAVACADIEKLGDVYASVPETIKGIPVNTEKNISGEVKNMEWNDITMEELVKNRGDLVSAIAAEATKQERERIQAIDEAAGISDATADDAKYVNPVDAGTYALNALKAQRQKGEKYMEARAQETKQMDSIKAEEPKDDKADDNDVLAKAIAAFAKEVK